MGEKKGVVCPLFDFTTTGLKSKHITHFHPFLSISASAPTASLPVWPMKRPKERKGAEGRKKCFLFLRATAPAADPGRMVNE